MRVTIIPIKYAFTPTKRRISELEEELVDRFGTLSQHPRWFSLWIVAYFIWAVMHMYLHNIWPWYNDAKDLLLVTLLFSAFPYWVENSVKRTQAMSQELIIRSLAELSKLTEDLKNQQAMAATKDETYAALIARVITILEEKTNKDGRAAIADKKPNK